MPASRANPLLLPALEALAGSSLLVQVFHGMWTRDAGMKRMFHIVEKVARTESSVLARGESPHGQLLCMLQLLQAAGQVAAREPAAFERVPRKASAA